MVWNLEEAIAHYGKMGAPADQNMLIALLREIQKESGGSVPLHVLGTICESYGIRESLLMAIIRRIPGLRAGERHLLEICAGQNCGRHAGLASLAEELHRKAPEKFDLKFVPCMRMCAKGPNIRWDGKIHHRADEKLLRELTGMK